MEDWEVDFQWLKIQHYVKDSMKADALPDFRSVLFMIGIQELGDLRNDYTKEEKQDLMHIAVCTLLENDGYYVFAGRDEDNWPHWDKGKILHTTGVAEQERLLKEKIILYFTDREDIFNQFTNNDN